MLDTAGLPKSILFTFVPLALLLQLKIRDSTEGLPPYFVVPLSGLSDFPSGLCPPSKSPGFRALTGVELLQVSRLLNQFDISRLDIEFSTKIQQHLLHHLRALLSRWARCLVDRAVTSQANQLVIMFMTQNIFHPLDFKSAVPFRDKSWR